MAKKKNDTKNKKQAKKAIDASVKEAFVAEAQNITFTEEDIKNDEEERQIKSEEEESLIGIPGEEEKSEVSEDEPIEEILEPVETGEDGINIKPSMEEEPVNDTTVETEETVQSEDEELPDVPEEDITEVENEVQPTEEETVDDMPAESEVKEEPQPKKECIKPKKRSTSKEVYGYHWMGIIYDE